MERGVCPYGDDCHFAHGHEQLRKFPTKMQQEAKRRMEEAKNAMKTGFSKEDPPPTGFPLKIGEPFKLFILRDSNFQNLVVSVRDQTWIAQVGEVTRICRRECDDDDEIVTVLAVVLPKYRGSLRIRSSKSSRRGS